MNADDLNNLGLISFRTGEPAIALEHWLAAQKLNDDPRIDMNIGFALSHLARFDEALPHFERAWKRDNGTHDSIRVAYGSALIRHGRWLEAWDIYNPTVMFKAFKTGIKPWHGESLEGKEVLVTADGGFGDTLMFSRYLPEFSKLGARVSFLNTPALVPLFMDNPYFSSVNLTEQRHFDYWISQFDLVRVFGVTPDNVLWPGPYFASNGDWRWERDDDRPHVGLCWTSTEKATPQPWFRFRSLMQHEAQQLYDYDGVKWVNLQIDKRAPSHVIDVAIENWADTANLLDSLDLIITVDTSILHLAGAMGRPTWAILGGFYDAKFLLGRTDCLWYPSVRLFHNGEVGFSNSIRNVLDNLGQFVKENKECLADIA